jgi:hypothetical protein
VQQWVAEEDALVRIGIGDRIKKMCRSSFCKDIIAKRINLDLLD